MNLYRIYPSQLCIVKELPNMNDYPVAPPKGGLLYAFSFQSLRYINFMDVFSFRDGTSLVYGMQYAV